MLGTPFFIFFGWLSDKIGRLKIILAGCLIAAVTYFPLFSALTNAVNPDLAAFQEKQAITVTADPATCNFHIFVGPWSKFTDCDRAKDFVTKLGVSFKTESGAPVRRRRSRSATTRCQGWNTQNWTAAFTKAGYPAKADPAKVNWVVAELILFIMVIYVTMVYGPIAAFLVEMFPTKIRYTSMSLPYHIGNGWFGGMLPLLATAIVATTGDIYAGLWYPIIVAVMTLIIGAMFLRETKDVDITSGSGVADMVATKS